MSLPALEMFQRRFGDGVIVGRLHRMHDLERRQILLLFHRKVFKGGIGVCEFSFAALRCHHPGGQQRGERRHFGIGAVDVPEVAARDVDDLEHPLVLVKRALPDPADRGSQRAQLVVVELDAPYRNHAAPDEQLAKLIGVYSVQQRLRVDDDLRADHRCQINGIQHDTSPPDMPRMIAGMPSYRIYANY
jgi:hypothetical protein